MNKIYSILELKSIDDAKRQFSGIASTPTPDRMEDVVEPKGAQYKLPLPLLSQHEHHKPIGFIKRATVTDAGIEVEGEIAKETGLAYVETAWKQIRAGLVRGLSIGFRALDWDYIKDSDGIHYKKWEMLETSAVTLPANADCMITTIKSFDQDPSKRSEVVDLLSARSPRVQQALERIERAKAVLDYRKK
jgi:HK97 family phage prohead protease